ncbi:MAG: DUF2065 domain-containing protein [Gammaproteobacteria bacterium]|nr:DUF2065 domain-containing protein [Gammaproteobacteria bacterium]
MWQELLIALALVLIIEGIFPFLHPQGMRKTMATISQLSDGQLRTVGVISMLLGVIALYIVY